MYKVLLLTLAALLAVWGGHAQVLRIMPMGDSITELDWQGGYRSYLYKLLSDDGIAFDYVGTKTTNHDDDNLGFPFPQEYWDHEGYNSATITGQTGSTWIWNAHVEEKLAVNPPDVILLLLGTNDLNNGCCSGADVALQMSDYLDQIWAVGDSLMVILGAPPSVDSTRYPVLNNRITEYCLALQALIGSKRALGRRLALADHHALMNMTTDLVGDGIHPSPAGYRKMADVWYQAIAGEVVLSAGGRPGGTLPVRFAMSQNYPNPFNPATTISFDLPADGTVTLTVTDVLGRTVAVLVRNERIPAGRHTRVLDAAGLPGGAYFCRIDARAAGATFTATRKALLLR